MTINVERIQEALTLVLIRSPDLYKSIIKASMAIKIPGISPSKIVEGTALINEALAPYLEIVNMVDAMEVQQKTQVKVVKGERSRFFRGARVR